MKAIIQHLRFPFSFLLMPVFLFSVWCFPAGAAKYNVIYYIGFVLHFLVYPASNAYNSTQDRDVGSVGLIKNPLPIPKYLLVITIIMDIVAIIMCFFINMQTTVLVAIYILVSRLYSWRKVRLKQYPNIGFLTVFICQGALVFFIVGASIEWRISCLGGEFHWQYFIVSLIPSLFIGSMYPLSQIYQHEQDRKDGVYTISAMLGYRNTFLFSGLQFIVASSVISYAFISMEKWSFLIIYVVSQIPIVTFFLYWFYKVMQDNSEANYKNTMYMNIISALCMNLCFLILLLI